MINKYRNNVWKIWLIQAMGNDYLLWGITVIYMLNNGLSLGNISIVISAWLASATIGQIPGGLFADNFGYKVSIICGSIISLVGISIFAFSTAFIGFLTGYAIYGFGSALIKGADEALVYEGLKQDKQESLFKRVIGKVHFNVNIYAMIASIAGGLLYSYIAPVAPFIVQVGLSASALALGLTLKSVPQNEIKLNVISQIKQGISYAVGTKNFSKIFIFSAIIGSVSISVFQYLQPLYKSLEIDVQYFGIIAAVTFLFRGLGSLYADKLGSLFSIDHYLVLHATVFSLFLIIMQRIANIPIILIIILFLFFLRGLYEPTIGTYINEKVSSSMRATMLSTNSQILFLTSSLTLLGTGVLADKYSLNTVFFGLSILSMVFLIIYILSLRKVRVE